MFKRNLTFWIPASMAYGETQLLEFLELVCDGITSSYTVTKNGYATIRVGSKRQGEKLKKNLCDLGIEI